MSPGQAPHGEREWQDAVGGTLQAAAYARAGTRLVLDAQHARLAAALRLPAGARLLDLGCGVGHLLHWLARHGAAAALHGTDLSLNSLRAARAGGVAGLCAGDAAALPYRDASFDAVVCNGAAHHLPDLPAALRELRRVLRPGGRLVLFEPVDSPLTGAIRGTLFRRSRYESPADLAHKHDFTRAAVEEALRAAGFRDLTVSAHDFLAYPLTGMYMALPWSGSRRVMRALLGLERGLDRVAVLRPLWNACAWRVLFGATRP
ncbi:MAG: class I SAM-dependent methyltransferase [Deltaproteobacteria bacterium]|nr:class I SAM-dependent methyltransferase [Deltaproteobacteria bacterium]